MRPTRPRLRLDRSIGTVEPPALPLTPAQRELAIRSRAAVDPARLRADVEALAGPRSRLHAPQGIARAERYLSDELGSRGWRVSRQPFTLRDVAALADEPFGKRRVVYPRLEGANLLAAWEGPSSDALVVVAHHDTVPRTPGADDNASALAVLLEVARLLPPETRRSIVLAVPDFEELGMVGSRVLVERQLTRWSIRGAIVMDAVGFRGRQMGPQRMPQGIGPLYPMQKRRIEGRGRGDWLAVLYRKRSERLARVFASWLRACAPGNDAVMVRDPTDLPLTGRALRLIPGARAFGRSDHVSFWQAGLPAIMLSDVAPWRNPHYHQPSDSPDTLDYDFLADVAAAVLLTVRTLPGRS
jgi:Peptidase family M28